jgi:hypothetical protein
LTFYRRWIGKSATAMNDTDCNANWHSRNLKAGWKKSDAARYGHSLLRLLPG